jgi:5'(3')-deoxyribonucleotidase
MHHTDSKFMVKGDFLLDDKTTHIREWSAEFPEAVGLLWNSTHNRSDEIPSNALRIDHWGEVIRLVKNWGGPVGPR